MIREVARQGVLPWPRFWTTTRPFNSPGGPILLKWALTVLVILALPKGDAFTFVVDLQSYPSQLFALLNVVGVWLIRKQRRETGLGRGEYQAWNVALVFSVLVSAFLLVMPLVPPAKGIYGGNVSFVSRFQSLVDASSMPPMSLSVSESSPCAVSNDRRTSLLTSVLYWLFWFHLLPRWKGFTWREEVLVLQNGELSKHFVREYPKDQEVDSQVDTVPQL